MNNFVLVIDYYITHEQCDNLVNKFVNKSYYKENEEHTGYKINYDIQLQDIGEFKLKLAFDLYKKTYPELQMTPSKWILQHLRFKHFEPRKYYENWHCEHSFRNPYRVLN